jgi:UDP-N-acetylglucosamine acyltransferase
MPRIHPTTIIEGDVELADSVEIGPWCCLKGPIKLGEGTRLLRRVELYGPLTMGEGNVVYPNACLGFAPQDHKFDPTSPGSGTVIGHRNVLREGVTIHRATGHRPTTLGNDNYLMVNTHIAHDCVVGHHCTFANGALLGGHVTVDDRATLGGNSGVHQFCRVGRISMLGGVTSISQDLPPFCVVHASKAVGSINLVGLRRAGLRDHAKPLQRAFNILYRKTSTLPVAAAKILAELGDDPLCVELAQFVKSNTRGITGYHGDKDLSTALPPTL